MTLQTLLQNASPCLLRWMERACPQKSISTLWDLEQLRQLPAKDFPPPDSGLPTEGDWTLLGELTGLQVLEFPSHMPAGLIQDFSFLPRLTHLRKLDLAGTGFTDCALLSGLTELEYLSLPARKQLLHVQALEGLSCEVHTDESFYRDEDFPPYRVLPPRTPVASPPDCLAVHLVNDLSESALTLAAVERLVRQVRAGKEDALFLSLDENGEEDFLTLDLKAGWAALAYQTWDQAGQSLFYQPINEAYDSVEEDAPVEIGGQTPVPKRFALDDLDLAARCVDYFARTGRLYPGLPWAEFTE